MPPTVETLDPFGAEISGLAGAELSSEAGAAECRNLLARHHVLVYRDVAISDEELVALTRRLGRPLPARTGEHRFSEIDTITLDPGRTDPRLAALRRGNFLWHFDGATGTSPQKATLLAAREIPESGGDTEFADTTQAYRELSADRRRKLHGLRVLHSFAAAQQRANPDADEEQRARWDAVPTREHPLTWTHRDGRISLLVGATAHRVTGLPEDEGAGLLEELENWVTQPRFVLRHQWREGDLVVWNNTTLLHRARPFAATARRLMHRTTLVGDETTDQQ
ncbi:TauD/TfdA dioxygenase family protein [Nocardia sp. NPDC051750]|uniref:TauD/TfdA dioxygenase family protein n=1 Tax=Nocardia sp. NPDC051750 TaxID=3364325 RepID=UPI0037B40054